MHDILVVLVHSIVTVARLIKPGGLRAVVAESALTRHQLLILNRSRKRAPSLRVSDRIIAGLCTLLMRPSRMLRCGVVLKPSTLLHFHHLLTKRKYHMLFSAKRRRRPGPKGPAQELIDAVVEMKRRNPTWGCPRIAQQITLAFGFDIDKDVVRRILGKHYRLESGSGGPSWLTFLGQAKDSLWSIDLFRCESLSLRMHWCWWLWTSSRAASSDLAFTAELSMGRHCAQCSSERFKGKLCRSISARTTIRCIGSTNGRPTFECWR